jgi:hypothetical protein
VKTFFKPTTGKESLHEITNVNGDRVGNFATSEIPVKSTMFPLTNVHKYTQTSPEGKTHDQINNILIVR